MDPKRFDLLVRSLGRAATRRGAVAALLAGLVAPLAPDLVQAKRGRGKGRGGDGRKKRKGGNGKGKARGDNGGKGKGKGGNRNKNKDRRQEARPAQAEAACYPGSPCIPGPGKNLAKCDFSGGPALKGKNLKGANLGGATVARGDASGANLQGANLDKTCLVDATLSGALINASTNFASAIRCRTTMPDGSVNNSGCNLGTACCPTCDAAHPCPTGQLCCNGRCRSGDCCTDTQCTDPAKPICLNFRCSPCTTNRQCGSGRVCCDGRCETGQCCEAADCRERACQSADCQGNQCVYTPASGGACNDGDLCTVNDTCQDGSCAGTAKDCSGQADSCNDGVCRAADGQCVKRAKADGTNCGTNRACVGGTCEVSCGVAGKPCCAEGAACSTDDPCLVASCQSGTCTTSPKDCSAEGDACNDGVCRQSDGACVKRPKADGLGCNADNDSCTVGDSCQNGVCTPGAGVSCGHLDEPCNRGVCQPDGSCTREPRNNDELCLAGANVCTDVGACRNGSCVPGPAVVCTASDECHVAGICDPETGRCSNPTAQNGTACGRNGECRGGECVEPCLPVQAVCDPATDTCCDQEGEACFENAACSDAGEGRCCRPEGAFCEQSCDCCGGVCAGGVCCVPNQQCTSSNECCEGQACIDTVCTSVCGTDRALCGGGMGTAPCCDGYRCFDGECWPGTCLAPTEECSSASECCPDGSITCERSRPNGENICCHPYNATCRVTDECCGIRVCEGESKCCLGGPFDPDRPLPFGTQLGTCRGREHECCPGRRCHPTEKWCCVDEGQPVPNNEGGFLDCCHFAERDGVCSCQRKGEACAAPTGNPFLSNCCDGLFCFNGICNTFGCNGFGCNPSLPCCIGCTFDENTGCCDCPRPRP